MNFKHPAGRVQLRNVQFTRYDGRVEPPMWGTSSIEEGKFYSVNTPSFKAIKKRDMPMNDHRKSWNLKFWYPGNYGEQIPASPEPYPAPGFFQGYNGYCADYIDKSPFQDFIKFPDFDDVQTLAITKILNKIKDSDVNLAQAWGERKQAVDMISKSLSRIAGAAGAIRGGNLAKASRIFGFEGSAKHLRKEIKPSPNNLANHWLEYQYGWKPLLSDIKGSAEAIAKSFDGSRFTRAVAEAKMTNKAEGYPVYYNQGYPNGNVEIASSHMDLTVKYIIDFTEENALAARFAQTGIENPLNLAWELLPYSFVVDWFIPVGSFLSSLDATMGLSFKKGVRVTKYEGSHQTRWKPSSRPPGFAKVYGCQYFEIIYDYDRRTMATFPRPVIPDFKPKLGLERIVSGLSLLTQAFHR